MQIQGCDKTQSRVVLGVMNRLTLELGRWGEG